MGKLNPYMEGLAPIVEGEGFRVSGLGFRVQVSGLGYGGYVGLKPARWSSESRNTDVRT